VGHDGLPVQDPVHQLLPVQAVEERLPDLFLLEEGQFVLLRQIQENQHLVGQRGGVEIQVLLLSGLGQFRKGDLSHSLYLSAWNARKALW
jgi:hypothetical protein